jgi:hypothetical protein
MNKKIILLTLVSVFLLSAMIVTSPAQTRTVGVSKGDWFKYNVNFNWTSTDPSATIPISLNETERTMIAIVGVSGKNVSGQLTTYYKNGTEETVGGYVDIETGEGEKMAMFVVSADLGENDTIYTSDGWSFAKINETIVRTYPDRLRDTNHLNITAEFSSEEVYQSMSLNYYWDKSTGILVELSEVEVIVTYDYVTISSLLSRITDSNIWIVPEFPSYLILPLFMTATLLAVMVYRRKHSMQC